MYIHTYIHTHTFALGELLLTEDPTTGALRPALLTEDPTTGTLQPAQLGGPRLLLSTFSPDSLTKLGNARRERKRERIGRLHNLGVWPTLSSSGNKSQQLSEVVASEVGLAPQTRHICALELKH